MAGKGLEPAPGFPGPGSAFDAVVAGRVQGVGFRYSTVEKARGLGLVGWVRNNPDGDVEIHAEGRAKDLADLAEWLHEGPPGARVTAVTINRSSPTGCFDSFGVDF